MMKVAMTTAAVSVEDASLQKGADIAAAETTSPASMYMELDQTICPDLGVSLMDVPNLMMILAGFNPL